jgi:RNA polymerase sigma factor (sigma-70 family)
VSLPPFQTLLDAHARDVYRLLVATAGPAHADDCFQETFLAALRAYPQLASAERLRGWLMTIAYRKAMDAHRSQARRPTPVATVPDKAAPDHEAPDPALWDAVQGLPVKQRAAIILRYVADLPYADIARAIGCSEAAARQNARAGLHTLRERGWAEGTAQPENAPRDTTRRNR